MNLDSKVPSEAKVHLQRQKQKTTTKKKTVTYYHYSPLLRNSVLHSKRLNISLQNVK